MTFINSYATPLFVDNPIVEARLADDGVLCVAWKAFLRWTAICYCCALPSFLWGMAIGSQWRQVAAMVCGIFCFVVAYSAGECSPVYRRLRNAPHVASTLKIGFGLRIGVSVLFPVGMFFDLFLGEISIALAKQGGLRIDPMSGARSCDGDFIAFFATTLIQGMLVNLALFAFMAVVYGIKRLGSCQLSAANCQPNDEARVSNNP